MKKRFTEEQIVAILREAEQTQSSTKDVCRKNGITEQTFYRWKAKYGGMDVSMVRQAKALEAENAELKKLLGEQTLLIAGLRNALSKKY
jgi:putative transposase